MRKIIFGVILAMIFIYPCQPIFSQSTVPAFLDQKVIITIEGFPSDIVSYECYFRFYSSADMNIESGLIWPFPGTEIIPGSLILEDSKGIIQTPIITQNTIEIPDFSITLKKNEMFEISLKYKAHLIIVEENIESYQLQIGMSTQVPVELPSSLTIELNLPYGMTQIKDNKYVPILYWRTNENFHYYLTNRDPIKLQFTSECINGNCSIPTEVYFEVYEKPEIILNEEQTIDFSQLYLFESIFIQNNYDKSFKYSREFDITKLPVEIIIYDSEKENIIDKSLSKDPYSTFLTGEIQRKNSIAFDKRMDFNEKLIKPVHFITHQDEIKWRFPFDQYQFSNLDHVTNFFENTSQITLYRIKVNTDQYFVVSKNSYLFARPSKINLQPYPLDKCQVASRDIGIIHTQVEHQFGYSFQQIEFITDNSISSYEIGYIVYLEREPEKVWITTLWGFWILIAFFGRRIFKSLANKSRNRILYYISTLMLCFLPWIEIYLGNFPSNLILWHKGLWLMIFFFILVICLEYRNDIKRWFVNFLKGTNITRNKNK